MQEVTRQGTSIKRSYGGFRNNTGSGTEGVSESERHHQDEGMRSRGLDEGVISSLIKSRNPPTQRAY